MYLSIDIGGTKTLIACLDQRGRVSRRDKFPTPNSLDEFLNKLFIHLEPYRSLSPNNIIVAVPGIVKNNCPLSLGNRPDWHNPPLNDVINKLFSCPIYFENDASLGAVYESSFYSGRSIYLTFSTGVGGGIANRGVLENPVSADFEPGHRLYEWQGEQLEWEDIASCKALEARYGARATSLRSRDKYADIAARILVGLVDIIEENRPNTIIIGGPLAKLYRHYSRPLKKLLKDAFKDAPEKLPKLKPAHSPTEAVTRGMYLYAKQRENGA